MYHQPIFPMRWRRGSTLASGLCLVLLLALLTARTPGLPREEGLLRMQPELIRIAQQTPSETVAVIVQKSGAATDLESRVAQLGGSVTTDLHIINAFAAQLPAQALTTLARLPGVRWVSLDAPVVKSQCTQCIDTANLQSMFIKTVGADQVWNTAPYLQGQGVGIAVVDSGVNPQGDLYLTGTGTNRLVANVRYNGGYNQTVSDGYGHGNHVAGIIASNGSASGGRYPGIAPKANIINVKVSDDQGNATTSYVVSGLQWINNNRQTYNIRVVNISLNSSVNESYHTNPLAAAVEVLWINQVVVVVSAGNSGRNALYPPANDPFVITVGAIDDRGTSNRSDDVLAAYSGYGQTINGFSKPDLVAPGTSLISLLGNSGNTLSTRYPGNVVWVNGVSYFRMSGTSMAAPVVAGAAALLLQDEPSLTPDQVKYRLKATTYQLANTNGTGAGGLDVVAAVNGTTTQSANTGLQISQLLTTNTSTGISSTVNWNSVNWNSVNWNSVNWNSVNWNSVNWNSVTWNASAEVSAYWGN